MEKLLQGTIETAKQNGHVTEKHLERVNVDTTVQEKAIAYPTDSRLYHKARRILVRLAKRAGIELRQSYERLGKRAFIMQGRYSHARQTNRAKREQKRLKIFLGRVVRDIRRKCPAPEGLLAIMLERSERIFRQQRNGKNKLYSLQAPEVECIAKGKAHKKYEFGCKVSLVSTSRDSWIIGAQAVHGNPYDGHTLKEALKQAYAISGWQPEHVYCDKGYKGVPKVLSQTEVHFGQPEEDKHEAAGVGLVQTPQRYRTNHRSLEVRPSDGSQLSQGRRRRQDQRHPGRLRLQHQEAPPSDPFVAFQRAVQTTCELTDEPDSASPQVRGKVGF